MPVAASRKFVLRSDDEAWRALEALMQMGDDEAAQCDVVCEGWPRVAMKTDIGHASLRPEMMRAFVDLQDALLRSYALVAHGQSNIALLKDEERSALEFDVKLSAGSSVIDANTEKVMAAFAGRIKKMEPKDLLNKGCLVLVAIGLMYFATDAWKSDGQNRLKLKEAEIASAERLQSLDKVFALSSEETKRAQMLHEAHLRAPVLAKVQDQADDAKVSFYKHAPKDGNVVLQGIPLTGPQAHALATKNKVQSERAEVVSVFAISDMSNKGDEDDRVQVRDLRNGLVFSVSLSRSKEHEVLRKVFERALFDKVPVHATVSVIQRRGKPEKAKFVGAELFEGGWDAYNAQRISRKNRPL